MARILKGYAHVWRYIRNLPVFQWYAVSYRLFYGFGAVEGLSVFSLTYLYVIKLHECSYVSRWPCAVDRTSVAVFVKIRNHANMCHVGVRKQDGVKRLYVEFRGIQIRIGFVAVRLTAMPQSRRTRVCGV